MALDLTVKEVTNTVEAFIHSDPGKRGLEHVWKELEETGQKDVLYNLHSAASSLFKNGQKVLVCTGFVIPSVQAPETDGPPGALAICRALHFLGREVSLITAPGNMKLLKALLEHEKKVFGYDIALIEAPLLKDVQDKIEWARGIVTNFDHLVSIEILGAATDGGYYNMRGTEASAFNSPIDALFALAKAEYPKIRSVSVGDGGNEIGLGNIYPLISKYVPKGELIGTRVQCDFLITAGVSNWGGYAIAAALYLQGVAFNKLAEQDRHIPQDKLAKLLPSVEVEKEIMDVMLANGAVDGPTCEATRKVDSFDMEFHDKVISSILEILHPVR